MEGASFFASLRGLLESSSSWGEEVAEGVPGKVGWALGLKLALKELSVGQGDAGRLHEARVWGRAKGLQERSRHRRKKGLEKRSLTMKEAEALARPAVTAMEQTLAAMQEALRPTIEHYVTYLDEGSAARTRRWLGGRLS